MKILYMSANSSGYRVAESEDRFGEQRMVAGLSQMFIKVSAKDTAGGMLLVEVHHTHQGGPPQHVHYEQDEWFYVIEGQYIVEVGSDRFELGAGDSVFAPRQIPHAWAFVGKTKGTMLIALQPAGRMEEFFERLAKEPGFDRDPSVSPQYGFERVGGGPLETD